MKPRLRILYDDDRTIPENIASYMHCKQCMVEWHESFQGILSPRDYARTQVGIMPDGRIQVVCTRHNCNMVVLSFEIASHEQSAADAGRKDRAEKPGQSPVVRQRARRQR